LSTEGVRRAVIINGHETAYESASTHIEDRGYQFGESVYEVLAFYSGTPLRLSEHLSRLSRSAVAIGLELPSSESLIRDIARAAGMADIVTGSVYIQVTSGVSPRAHIAQEKLSPTVTIIAQATPPDRTGLPLVPITCVTVPDERWARCNIKTTNLLPNVLARKTAIQRGYDDALFVRDGLILEGPSNNVFFVRNGGLLTPPANNFILEGITRAAIIEVARKLRLEVRQEPVTPEAAYGSQEAFITSTIMNIRPISVIDGQRYPSPIPGPVTDAVYENLLRLIDDETNAKT